MSGALFSALSVIGITLSLASSSIILQVTNSSSRSSCCGCAGTQRLSQAPGQIQSCQATRQSLDPITGRGFPPASPAHGSSLSEALEFLGQKQQTNHFHVQWSSSSKAPMQEHCSASQITLLLQREDKPDSSVPVLGSTRLFLHIQRPLCTSHPPLPPPPVLTTSQAFSTHPTFPARLPP